MNCTFLCVVFGLSPDPKPKQLLSLYSSTNFWMPRNGDTITLLPNGLVLAAGGSDPTLNSAERYAP